MKRLQIALSAIMFITAHAEAAKWQMNQGDIQHTGRADYTVPQSKLNDTFFDDIEWQKTTAGQSEGSAMIFYDGAGPGGADLVCLGQSPGQRCVTAVDRHTGAFLWQGGPTAGSNIGKDTGAFSNDGAVFYMTSDTSPAHFYAWNTAVGPGTVDTPLWWDSSSDPNEHAISMRCPVVAPDGRIFLHRWNNKVSAAQDNGTSLTLCWEASYDTLNCMSDVSLYDDEGDLIVVTSGRRRRVAAFDGDTGAELWQYDSTQVTDCTVTIDPNNGNIYLHAGTDGDTYVIGLDKDGGQLTGWPSKKVLVRDWIDSVNNKHESHSTGCLSHDGETYYFQTDSDSGDGLLFAVNTSDGTVKWTYPTNCTTNNADRSCSPIVTVNGVVIVGNNDYGTYFAIQDGSEETPDIAVLLDTFQAEEYQAGLYRANVSATLSPDGLLYLPLQTAWTTTNGDGDIPTNAIDNCMTAFSLAGCDPIRGDVNNDCKVDFSDFAELSAGWLDCGLQPQSDCYE